MGDKSTLASPPVSDDEVWAQTIGDCYKGRIYEMGTSYSKSYYSDSVSRVGPTGTDSKFIHDQVHALNESVQRQLEEPDSRYMELYKSRDVKNPHPVGIPAGTAPFGAPAVGDFFPTGMGAGITPALRGPCIYKKIVLPLINISNIYIYLYFYVISHLFNLIIKNISNISNCTPSHSHSLI